MKIETVIHILRNPYGWSKEDQRKAFKVAADKLEGVDITFTTDEEGYGCYKGHRIGKCE
jgi:hypothetical protein